jgi:TP901 family phage tail tape measure protein
MAGKFSIEAIFSGKDGLSSMVGRMNRSFATMTTGAGRFGNALGQLDKRFTGWAASLGSGLKTAGTALGVLGAGVGAAAFTLGKSGAEFEAAISRVGAVGLQTRAQIAPLEAEALRLGAATQFTATQAANAMELMARAGFSNKEILEGVGGVLNAAAASGLEMAEVASHVSNVLKGMGLATSEATRVSDVLALASARTNSSIGSLGESMKILGPIARQLNIPFESAVAQVALLQDAGLDASMAATSLASSYSKLAAPVGTTKKALAELGIQVADSFGNMKLPDQLMGDILKATSGIQGNVGKMAAITNLVGLESQKGMLNLTAAVAEGRLASLTKELEGAHGTGKKMAALSMDNLLGDWELFSSAVDGVKIKLFQLQGGPLRGLVKGMTDWVSANQDLIGAKVGAAFEAAVPFVREFVAGLTEGWNAAWPAIKGALDILFDGFGSGATWLTTVKDFAVLLGKVTAAAVGLAAVLGGMLAAGVQLATKIITGAVDLIMWAWNAMIAAIGGSILWFDDTWARIKAFFANLPEAAINAAKNVATGFADGLRNGAKWVIEAASEMGQAAIDAIEKKLGIDSPSKAFIKIGGFSAEGLAGGFERDMPSVTQRMETAIKLPALPSFEPLMLDAAATSALAGRLQLAETIISPLGLPRESEEPEAQNASRAPRPEVVSTETALLERVIERVERKESEETTRLIIEDKTGKARLEGKPSKKIKLQDSGAFNGKPKADA